MGSVCGGAGSAGRAGGVAMCATLYVGDCGGWALFAGGVGGAGGDALCATLLLDVPEMLEMLDVLDVLKMLDVLDVLEVIRRVLL